VAAPASRPQPQARLTQAQTTAAAAPSIVDPPPRPSHKKPHQTPRTGHTHPPTHRAPVHLITAALARLYPFGPRAEGGQRRQIDPQEPEVHNCLNIHSQQPAALPPARFGLAASEMKPTKRGNNGLVWFSSAI